MGGPFKPDEKPECCCGTGQSVYGHRDKQGAAIYKCLDLNQIDEGVKNAKKRSALRRWLHEKRPKAQSLGCCSGVVRNPVVPLLWLGVFRNDQDHVQR